MDQRLEGKQCPKCGQVKPLSEFYRNRSTKDGLSRLCKTCRKAARKESYARHSESAKARSREWYHANKERARESSRRWQAGHQGHLRAYRAANREKKRAYMRQWRRDNAEHVETYRAAYKEANADQIKARKRRYNKANAGRIAQYRRGYRKRTAAHIADYQRQYKATHLVEHRAHQHARDGRIADLPGSWTVEQWEALCAHFQGICPRCGEPCGAEAFTVDHVIPISWPNATNDISNLQPLCKSCNPSKGDRSDADYRPWQVVKWAYGQSSLFSEK